jgi:hypothetical protein
MEENDRAWYRYPRGLELLSKNAEISEVGSNLGQNS